jgi:hypothetical protein
MIVLTQQLATRCISKNKTGLEKNFICNIAKYLLMFIIPLHDISYKGALMLRRSVTKWAVSRPPVFVYRAYILGKGLRKPFEQY